MIDLHFAPTGSGLRATVASNETGLPYRLHKLDLNKGEQRTPEFRKINPAGSIPVVVDGEAPGGKSPALNRSAPIVLYCAEKSGRFIPASAATRALFRANGKRHFPGRHDQLASGTQYSGEVGCNWLRDAFLVHERTLQA